MKTYILLTIYHGVPEEPLLFSNEGTAVLEYERAADRAKNDSAWDVYLFETKDFCVRTFMLRSKSE